MSCPKPRVRTICPKENKSYQLCTKKKKKKKKKKTRRPRRTQNSIPNMHLRVDSMLLIPLSQSFLIKAKSQTPCMHTPIHPSVYFHIPCQIWTQFEKSYASSIHPSIHAHVPCEIEKPKVASDADFLFVHPIPRPTQQRQPHFSCWRLGSYRP
jgi:hypothetical protein